MRSLLILKESSLLNGFMRQNKTKFAFYDPVKTVYHVVHVLRCKYIPKLLTCLQYSIAMLQRLQQEHGGNGCIEISDRLRFERLQRMYPATVMSSYMTQTNRQTLVIFRHGKELRQQLHPDY